MMPGSGGASADFRLADGPILVLGIGNPLMGDDGVAARVLKLLAVHDLPANVTLKESSLPGWDLSEWFDDYETVIVIDAMDLSTPETEQLPGSWRRFDAQEVSFTLEDRLLSLHHPGLASGLALAQALDRLPENLILYGIQPANLTPGAGLSAEVEASTPEVVASLLSVLGMASPGTPKYGEEI